MRILLIVGVVFSLSGPVSAGPLLEAALARAASVTLSQDEPPPVYSKGTLRKVLEWTGIIVGSLDMVAIAAQRDCVQFNGGEVCESWPAGSLTAAAVVTAVSAISKALPDPD